MLKKNTKSPIEGGWGEAFPLEYYSSLHELSLLSMMGVNRRIPGMQLLVQFNFNLQTPLQLHPQAKLAFHIVDADKPLAEANCCYSITQLQRWRMDVSAFDTFDAYLGAQKRWHRCNFTKSEKKFKDYEATVAVLSDWKEHIDDVYRIYCNVAKRHNDKLYDLSFFHLAAQRPDYKLLSAWYQGELIGMFILREEGEVLHSTCCGLDYTHSSTSFAYTWLHFELIRYAIENKFRHIDAGLTADDSKKAIGFQPIQSRLDIYAQNFCIRHFLKLASRLTTATVTSDSKLKIGLRRR